MTKEIVIDITIKEGQENNVPKDLEQRVEQLINAAFAQEIDEGLIDVKSWNNEFNETKLRDIMRHDNIDSETTRVYMLDNGYVAISPCDVMLAMVQNLPVPLDEKYEVKMWALIDELKMDLRTIKG